MGLSATVVDPVTDPPPPGWDALARRPELLPTWDYQLLRVADWCARTPSSAILVAAAGGTAPVAAFHARHLGPARPGRFAPPGRIPPVSLTECRAVPLPHSGIAFADGLAPRDRAEAVLVFERALRQRVGPGGRGIAYRHLTTTDELAAIPGAGRLRIRLTPTMVLHNQWPDLGSYLAALPGKLRNRLRKIRRGMDGDRSLVVQRAATIEPAEACWLAEQVRQRHRPRGTPQPPCPAGYFARLSQLPGSRFLTYRTAQGRLLAYVTMYDTGTDLVAGVWGSREPTDGGRRNLYFDLYLRQVEWLVAAGRRRLVLGRGMADLKARFGARAEPRWGVLGLR